MQRDWINSLRKSRITAGCLTLKLDLLLRFADHMIYCIAYKWQIKRKHSREEESCCRIRYRKTVSLIAQYVAQQDIAFKYNWYLFI